MDEQRGRMDEQRGRMDEQRGRMDKERESPFVFVTKLFNLRRGRLRATICARNYLGWSGERPGARD
jgi:hypothetical protein